MSRRRQHHRGECRSALGTAAGYGAQHACKEWSGTRETRLRCPSRGKRARITKVKSRRAQRESEGIVVPDGATVSTKAVRHNAAGGKGPCGGHAEIAGKREGLAGKTGPKHPVGVEPIAKARRLQRQLWAAAKRAPGGQVHVLYPAGGSDALTVACKLFAAPVQPLSFGTGPHNAARRRPLVSRVREIRMHGLSGGPAAFVTPLLRRS